MNIAIIIIIILWFSIVISMMPGIVPYAQKLDSFQQIVVGILIIFGAPFIMIAEVLELILNIFLDEGWRDDDDDKFGY